jgi:hypothetical protein
VSNFTGFSAAANMTMDATTNQMVDGSIADQSVGANVQASYGYALNANTVLSVGATYALTDAKAGNFVDQASDNGTAKLKKQASIYIEPGFLVSPSTLVYGKVSFDTATGNAVTPAYSVSADVKGTGFGVGIRTMLDKNLFLQVEAKQTTFDKASFPGDTDQFQVKTTNASIGIGYKF